MCSAVWPLVFVCFSTQCSCECVDVHANVCGCVCLYVCLCVCVRVSPPPQTDSVEVFRQLLGLGAPLTTVDACGDDVLGWAARHNAAGIIALALSRGVNPNAPPKAGVFAQPGRAVGGAGADAGTPLPAWRSPLHLAAQLGHVEVTCVCMCMCVFACSVFRVSECGCVSVCSDVFVCV